MDSKIEFFSGILEWLKILPDRSKTSASPANAIVNVASENTNNWMIDFILNLKLITLFH